MKTKTLSNNIITLIILTVFLKLIGFLSRSVVAYSYGTSSYTDIYYTASGFVDSISAIILAGLTVGVVNIYLSSTKSNRDEFISRLLKIIIILMATIGILNFLLAGSVANLLMPGASETHNQLKLMLRTMSVAFPLQGIVAVFGALLQAEKNFTPVKITGTITSITNIICTVLLAQRLGINALVLAYISGTFLNSVFLYSNIRNKYSLKYNKIVFDDSIQKMFIMIFPLTMGMAAHQINLIIDKSIASTVTIGAVSALSYASFLYLCVENIIIQSVSTAIFPEIAEEFQNNSNDSVIASKVKNTIIFTLYLLIPIVVVCISNADFIVRIVYMRGSFDKNSLSLTVAALSGYMIGLPFLAIRDVITRAFYAYGDTKKPVLISLVAVGVNIILDILLSNLLGVFGITVATSISNVLSSIMLCINIRRYNQWIIDKTFIRELLPLVVTMILSILLGFVLSFNLDKGWLSFIVCGVMACIIELVAAKISNSLIYSYLYNIKRKIIQKS